LESLDLVEAFRRVDERGNAAGALGLGLLPQEARRPAGSRGSLEPCGPIIERGCRSSWQLKPRSNASGAGDRPKIVSCSHSSTEPRRPESG
jgi:hypothetical protein